MILDKQQTKVSNKTTKSKKQNTQKPSYVQ